MTHQEITDGNNLIVGLMDSTIKIEQEDVKDIPLAFLATEDLKFHVSWKWLMPVVIKIEEDLGYDVRIEGKYCRVSVDDDTNFEATADKKIEAVWRAIVNFLGSR
ncbi:MAG: hypothetical protein R3281_04425 [Balneolaceae bacterium]|nr:hypothetical protein [Balneolaceae bacterium]